MSRIDRVKELQELTIDLFEKENTNLVFKDVYKAKLTILQEIIANGYVDTPMKRFIEMWNQNSKLELHGWHKEDII